MILKVTKKQYGFTIVELLIVIVIIAILAAITVIAYNGIQSRARASAASAALNQAQKKILIAMNDGTLSSYPADQAAFDALGLSTTNVSYQYSLTNSGSGYCITATVGTTSYKVTNDSQPTGGGCAGHGQGGQSAITNLVMNPSFEGGTSGWGISSYSSIAQITGSAPSGTKYLRLSRSATGDAYASHTLTTTPPASSPYTLSFWVWGDTNTTITDAILFRHSTGTNLASRASIPVTTTPTRIVMSGTSSATPTGTLQIILRATSTVGQNIYYDGFMVTAGSETYNYADGNSENWVWSSTVNNSISYGPPQ